MIQKIYVTQISLFPPVISQLNVKEIPSTKDSLLREE